MEGIEFAEVRDAIVAAFNGDEFDMFLYERLNFDRPTQVADGPFKLIVTNVLRTAQKEGWDSILIAEVAAVRPLKRDVQEIYKKYAQALVDQGRQQKVGDSLQKAIDRYGLAPRVIVQTGGAYKFPSSVIGDPEGLERSVKPYLPSLDVAVWGEQLLKVGTRVCRVEVDNTALGTGFLVGPDTVITNYHVLRNVVEKMTPPGKVKLRFDYIVLPNNTISDGSLVSLHATDWLIDTTPFTKAEAADKPDGQLPTLDELDFALVKLERAFGSAPLRLEVSNSSPRGWISVPMAPPPMHANMPVLIMQHPNAGPLKLAVDTAGVIGLNANGTRVRYATNTDPGSSGSPCFDIQWKLIALHHYGDPLHGKVPQYNQGIPIAKIRDRLKRVGKESALGGQMP
jgi:Trypsin-like peptidase domain/Effector-associated domain 1